MSSHAFQFGLDAVQPAFTPSPTIGPLAGYLLDTGAPAVAHALHVEPSRGQERTRSLSCRLVSRPQRLVPFRDVSFECRLSRIFPVLPRTLASVHSPRPAALRCSASSATPCGSGFPNKNLLRNERAAAVHEGQDFSPEPPRKHISALGSGAPMRPSGQCVPRATRANTNRRKHHGTLRKQSHSEGLPRQGR